MNYDSFSKIYDTINLTSIVGPQLCGSGCQVKGSAISSISNSIGWVSVGKALVEIKLVGKYIFSSPLLLMGVT